MVQPPTDSEFMGVIKHDPETLYGLLAEDPESSSSSNSSNGSHHPYRECFMTQTPEGHVQNVSGEETTPTGNPDARIEAEMTAPSHIRMEQLRARKLEIDDAGNSLSGSTETSRRRSSVADTVGTHAPWPVICIGGSSPMMGLSLTSLGQAKTSPQRRPCCMAFRRL